ncbi:hypothetical protein AWJ20_596 [Sugiyamaella lignohabitans]|uniref:Protein-tyrosine-phosphatase n=1 Tax=Sugiyamaella lignohabitans TaxID=796027 RepID=A0A167D124_9ASCO|nr:uncharacterized protein AWJ20_596 [Sugiyamaella lignohabitans]ANB12346.1 hypothetical protein AWJ20_596 [Sugiyamaella lignohabitans]
MTGIASDRTVSCGDGGQVSFPRVDIKISSNGEYSSLENWQHEDRNRAQLVADNLYLGPMSVLRDKQFIIKNNIRVLISLVDPRLFNIVDKRSAQLDLGPALKVVYVHTEPASSLSAQISMDEFMLVSQEINLARADHVSSLVFCETGNEKAAAAVAAHLISTRGFTAVQAIQHVHSSRFSVHSDSQTIYYLQAYESLCSAQNAVQSPSSVQPKRQREPDEQFPTGLTSKRVH